LYIAQHVPAAFCYTWETLCIECKKVSGLYREVYLLVNLNILS